MPLLNVTDCSKCKKEIEEETSFTCHKCCLLVHSTTNCSGLSRAEIALLKSKKKKHLFICDNCADSLASTNSLHQLIQTLKDEIQDLKSKISTTHTSNDSSVNVESFIMEYNDREVRKKNLIIHGITESPSRSSDERHSHDIDSTKTLIKKINPNLNNEIHVIRLGEQRTDKSIRPVKVILSNADDALKVLKGKRRHDVFNYLKESKINISPDLTIMQRQHMRDLKAQLETRKANGELITIKYRNGSPTIVPEPAQHPKN